MFSEENEVVLKSFQNVVIIDFGKVIIGTSKLQTLTLRNDSKYSQEVCLTKNPKTGFLISFSNGIVDSNSVIRVEISWIPLKLGGIYEIITFKINNGISVSVKLIGTAIEAKKILKSNSNNNEIQKIPNKNMKILKEKIGKENLNPILVQDIDDHILFKSDKEARAGQEFDKLNSDDSWLIGQESNFVKWLNHIFRSNETKTKIEDHINNEGKYKSQLKSLYQRPDITKVIHKIDLEMSRDSLSFKQELLFRLSTIDYKDLMEFFLNYNNIWLTLAMTTILDQKLKYSFEEINNDQIIREHISNWMLWSEPIAKKYGCKKGSLLTKKDFEVELHRYILRRFFTLVFFLDVAKRSNILPEDVNLFKKTSFVKSSAELLIQFTCRFVKGEGTIMKRLNTWGCKVCYVQSELDNFDFTVSNLSLDISDGVRLGKLAKIFIGTDILNQLRLPAIDIIRKQFNLNLVASVFKEAGTELITYNGQKIDMNDVLEGHREKTLAALWCILSRYYIDAVVDKSKISLEIKKIRGVFGTNITKSRDLLFAWVESVCNIYNCHITELSCFNDGRALCFLIHHYLPESLRLCDIKHKTTQTIKFKDQNSKEELELNALTNFQSFINRLKDIGGAPIILPENQIPNGDLIISTLAYFSSRIIDLMKLSRAASCIQRAWKKYKLCYMFVTYYIKHEKDVIFVQSYVRSWLARRICKKRIHNIIMCQSSIRKHQAMKKLSQINAAVITIQRYLRGFCQRSTLLKQKSASIVIQTFFRGYIIRKQYENFKHSAIIIQKNVRGYLLRRKLSKMINSATCIQKYIRRFIIRQRYMKIKMASVIIQKIYRGYITRKKYKMKVKSVILLQSYVKSYVKRKQFIKQRNSAIIIQKNLRMMILQRKFTSFKKGVIKVQSYVRKFICEMKYKHTRNAAIIIQKNIRCFKSKNNYRKLRESTIITQKLFRGLLCYRKFQLWKGSAMIIQQRFRSYVIRKKYTIIQKSIVIIQAQFRSYLCTKKYKHIYEKIIVLQKYTRRFLVKKQLTLEHKSATIIQKIFRTYMCYAKYQKQRSSIIVVQKMVKGFIARQSYKKCVKSIILIQSIVRAFVVRSHFIKQRNSAIIIQKNLRMIFLQRKYTSFKKGVIKVQSYVRMFICVVKYKRTRNAAIIIQKVFRGSILKRQFQSMRNGAISIQKQFRGYKIRKEIINSHKASTIIQKNFRRYYDRKLFLIKKKASIIIEKFVRGFLARKFYKINKYSMKTIRDNILNKRHNAATLIQKIFRGYRQRKVYKYTRKSIVFIQTAWKSKFERIISAATFIQRFWRLYKRRMSALTIQRIWRGKKVREHIQSIQIGVKVEVIRSRFIEAQKSFSTCKTVRFIGVKALEDLKKPNCTVRRILSCLTSLEKVTSLSREICRWLADSDAYNILMDLIHDCNRGVADLDIVSKSISVLFNLGKAAVLDIARIGPEMALFLKDLLIRNLNAKKGTKGVSIFCHSCLLLVLLIKMEQRSDSHNQSHVITENKVILSCIKSLQKSLLMRAEHNLNNNNNITNNSMMMEHMRLKPSWDLTRIKPTKSFQKRASTTALNDTKPRLNNYRKYSSSKDTLLIRPQRCLPPNARHNKPLPISRSTSSRLVRSISVSESLNNNNNNKDISSNIWDSFYQLYAINLLSAAVASNDETV